MTRSLTNRRTAAVIAATLALGIAPAAGARPIEDPSVVQPTMPAHPPATTVHVVTARPSGSDISDWGYVAIGSGVASLALLTAGGTLTATRRRRQRTTPRPKVAA